MLRNRVVVVAAVLVLAAACRYQTSDDDAGADAGPSVTTRPAAHRVVAEGTGSNVCAAADASALLADETFDVELVRWVFCADDDEVLSLRSVRPGEWEVRALPISGEATLEVTVADAGRAWVTHDGLDTAVHEHVWTADGGVTWSR